MVTKSVDTIIGVVIALLLIGVLAPVVLPSLFNTTAYGSTVPSWVPLILGILGAVAFVYIIYRLASGSHK